MITELEKTQSLAKSEALANLIINSTDRDYYYQMFADYIKKIAPMKTNNFLEPNSLENIKHNLIDVLQYISEVSEADTKITYSTGDLSKYFGVSITSINNWIKEGRFIGVTRSNPGKQARISEDTLWRSSNGDAIPVKDIVEQWNHEYSHYINDNKRDEKSAIINEIEFFETKYGSYVEFLKRNQYSDIELRDKTEWEYWVKRATE